MLLAKNSSVIEEPVSDLQSLSNLAASLIALIRATLIDLVLNEKAILSVLYTETKEGLKSQNASGQIINEAKLSDSLTFGRFLEATLGDGDAVGVNNIDIEFIGAQAGAYLVGNTKGGLVYDTYIAGSVIENKMGVTTSLMTADSKYYSSMLTTGASVTGTLQVKKVEIRPTLSTDHLRSVEALYSSTRCLSHYF